MLILSADLRTAILADCAARRPDEACGLLIGTTDAGQTRVRRAEPVDNVWPEPGERPSRFAIDPLAQMKADAAATADGLSVVGFYHSHPAGPAVPSGFDHDRAWPVYAYLIAGLSDINCVEFRSWKLDAAGSFVEHAVFIE